MRTQIRSSQDPGNLVIEARRRRALSQRQVAEAMGVTQAWISKVERGQSKAWLENVLRLTAFLGITLNGEFADSNPGSDTSEGNAGYPDLDDLL